MPVFIVKFAASLRKGSGRAFAGNPPSGVDFEKPPSLTVVVYLRLSNLMLKKLSFFFVRDITIVRGRSSGNGADFSKLFTD
jgi:hypothetical protein